MVLSRLKEDLEAFNSMEALLKTIMKKVMKDIFLKLMCNILKSCMSFIRIYLLPEREKLVDQKLVIHIRNLKQDWFKSQISFEKKFIESLSHQKAWLKPCIGMNTWIKKKAKNSFE